MKIGLVGAELLHAGGQTYMRNLLIEFRNFVNGPKNSKFYPHNIFKRIVRFLLWTAFIALHNIYRLKWRHCGYYEIGSECYVLFRSTFSFKWRSFTKFHIKSWHSMPLSVVTFFPSNPEYQDANRANLFGRSMRLYFGGRVWASFITIHHPHCGNELDIFASRVGVN
jgi:hypothetical protein